VVENVAHHSEELLADAEVFAGVLEPFVPKR
jgi:hypothetical protein